MDTSRDVTIRQVYVTILNMWYFFKCGTGGKTENAEKTTAKSAVAALWGNFAAFEAAGGAQKISSV